MNFLNKLERTFGWMAIGRLPVYVVTTQALLYLWVLVNPDGRDLINMDPIAVVALGEYWRLLTFIFLVPFQNPLFTFLYLYFQYVCGVALEDEWGSFPYTIFYLLGAGGAIGAAFLMGHDVGSAFTLNESIFLAFAALFPNFQILFFFIIPLRIKWLALFVWAHILFGFTAAPSLYKLAILLSLVHYILFFGKRHVTDIIALVRRLIHRHRYKDHF